MRCSWEALHTSLLSTTVVLVVACSMMHGDFVEFVSCSMLLSARHHIAEPLCPVPAFTQLLHPDASRTAALHGMHSALPQ
jgi:hypothetical protein